MPDEHGWEIIPTRSGRWQPLRFHHDCEQQVANTPGALAAHLAECPARLARAARQARQQQEATDRLRAINAGRRAAIAPPPPVESLF